MPARNFIKFINSLKQKKYRQKYGLFIIEGEKAVDELLEGNLCIHSVYATVDWFSDRPSQERSPDENFTGSADGKFSWKVLEISHSELQRISGLKTPNKVLAVVHIPEYKLEPNSLVDSLCLVLDNIQDPGNLGTLLRTAEWFGIENIILSENSADVTNPKVVQATMGSILRVRVHYTELPAFLNSPGMLQMPVFGAYAGAPAIYSTDLPDRGLIVLGNESQGISGEVEKFITRRIGIPSFPRKGKSPESLNMAIAGSLIIAEFRRRFL